MKTKLVNKDIRTNYTNELLMERGLSPEELQYFLNVPDDSYLQEPEELDYIDKAYQMFNEMTNLSYQDIICVVVDSDVDGFTSAAIFIQYFKKFNNAVHIKPILHMGKGHGLSDTIDKILEIKETSDDTVRFVVLPDSSSNDYEYHERLGAEC